MKRLAFLAAVLTLAACGASPEPDYFTLSPVDGAPAPHIATAVKIRRPALADYLDRPEFVRRRGSYQIEIEDFDQWAEPLDEMLPRVLAADLRQRLPDSLILTEDDAASGPVRFLVDMDIAQFNQTDDGVAAKVNLGLTDIAAPGAATARRQSIELTLTAPSPDDPDWVAGALSRLTGQIADRAAQAIEARLAATPDPAAHP